MADQMQQQQQQLRTWFDAIDTNRSGELDASELQQALRLGNLEYGLTDVVSDRELRARLAAAITRPLSLLEASPATPGTAAATITTQQAQAYIF